MIATENTNKTENEGLFPDPATINKDFNYHKNCIDYAISKWKENTTRTKMMVNSMLSYNGYYPKEILSRLPQEGKVKYKDYRLSKKIIDKILGEWLESPLNASVSTINRESILFKKKIQDRITAMQEPLIKEAVDRVKKTEIANPFNGVDYSNEDLFKKQNIKTKNEIAIQYMINDILRKGIRDQLYASLQNLLLTGECFFQVKLNSHGKLERRNINPINRISDEIDDDPFMERQPYIGEFCPMYLYEILKNYKLTSEEKERVKSLQHKKDNLVAEYPEYYKLKNGELCVNTYRLEWKTLTPDILKKDKKGNLAELSPEFYAKNEKRIKRESGKKYDIDIKTYQNIHQCVKIGHEIYVDWGPMPNLPRQNDEPFYTSYSYKGLIFNSVLSNKVSLHQVLEHIKEEYNIVRMMINRELYKYKGVLLGYDRAYLPRDPETGKPVPMEQIKKTMLDDGIFDFNSASDGNYGNDKISVDKVLQTAEVGLSGGIEMLLKIGYNLEDLANRLAGFNDERLGETPASATATSSVQNLKMSRSISAPIFYFFDRFVERILLQAAELLKISYGILRKDLGEKIIGNDIIGFIEIDKSILEEDFGVYLSDSRKEMEIRQRMGIRMDQSINAGEMRIKDAYAAEMAETLTEAKIAVDEGWKEMEMYRQESQRVAQEAQNNKIMADAQIKREEREDKQAHEQGMLLTKGALDAGLSGQEALMQYMLAEQESINKQKTEK